MLCERPAWSLLVHFLHQGNREDSATDKLGFQPFQELNCSGVVVPVYKSRCVLSLKCLTVYYCICTTYSTPHRVRLCSIESTLHAR